MGFLGPRGWQRAPGYTRRSFISQPSPHGIVARGWPGPRKRRRSRYEQSILDHLQRVTDHIARLNDREVAPLRDALAEFNRTHEGLRGSESIRLEDLLTQNAMGRLFAYIFPDGRIAYHRNAVNDVSRRLDWFEPQVGSILTRTPTGWLPTIPCEPGAICRLMPSRPMPGCCPQAQVTPNRV